MADTREVGNFVFTDLLIAGRRQEALAALRKALDDGAEPVVLIGSISYAYRSLLMAKDLMSRGVDRRQLLSSVRMRPDKQDTFFAAARRADIDKLRSWRTWISFAVSEGQARFVRSGRARFSRRPDDSLVPEAR